jgi:hypothetical protein
MMKLLVTLTLRLVVSVPVDLDWGLLSEIYISPNNQSERLILDTGSTVTWIYNSAILGGLNYTAPGRGFDPDQMSIITNRHADSQLEYADGAGVEIDVWGLRNFTIGDHSWLQRFGIVSRGSMSLNLEYSGILGLSPISDFVLTYPRFGFRPKNDEFVEMFFSALNPSMCESTIVNADVFDSSNWDIWGKVRIGDGLPEKVVFLPDSGSSAIFLPKTHFAKFRDELKEKGIAFLYDEEDRLRPGEVPCDSRQLLPEIHLEFTPSIVLTITPDMYVRNRANGDCRIGILSSDGDIMPVILGEAFFRHFLIAFDAELLTVQICKPPSVDGLVPETHIIQSSSTQSPVVQEPITTSRSTDSIAWTFAQLILVLVIFS